ncbi:hypothetical protein FQZ97_813250 [compost metagenome]
MQVDPGDVARPLGVAAQDLAQGLVAPGGRGAAKKQAVGKRMLPLRHRGLVSRLAVKGDPAVERGRVVRTRRPFGRQQQIVQPGVGRVHRQRLAEILKVAVEIDVFVRHAAQVRKAVGVERVDVEHRDPGLACVLAPGLIVGRVDLHPGAAIALGPVAGAADDEQALGVGRAIERQVHGQGLAVATVQGMVVAADGHASRCSPFQKQHPGTGVRRCKSGLDVDHADTPVRGWASHCSASRTQ